MSSVELFWVVLLKYVYDKSAEQNKSIYEVVLKKYFLSSRWLKNFVKT